MNEPHHHDRVMSLRMDADLVPKDVLSMNFMFCPLSEKTDCYWEFTDPLPDGTHQLRYVKNTPTNAKPVTTDN